MNKKKHKRYQVLVNLDKYPEVYRHLEENIGAGKVSGYILGLIRQDISENEVFIAAHELFKNKADLIVEEVIETQNPTCTN